MGLFFILNYHLRKETRACRGTDIVGGCQRGKVIECVHPQERTAPGPFIIHARCLCQALPGFKHLFVRSCVPGKPFPIRFIEIENLRGFCHRNHPADAVPLPDSLLQEFRPVSVQFFFREIVIQMDQGHYPVQPVGAVRIGCKYIRQRI